jgi:hypothetical protein
MVLQLEGVSSRHRASAAWPQATATLKGSVSADNVQRSPVGDMGHDQTKELNQAPGFQSASSWAVSARSRWNTRPV